MNIAQWYAFKFFFTTAHYAVAYVAAAEAAKRWFYRNGDGGRATWQRAHDTA